MEQLSRGRTFAGVVERGGVTVRQIASAKRQLGCSRSRRLSSVCAQWQSPRGTAQTQAMPGRLGVKAKG